MRHYFTLCLLVLLVLTSTSTLLAEDRQDKFDEMGMLRADTFGAGWAVDSLANYEIGRFAGRAVSYRFRASHAGTFTALEIYLAFRTTCDGCYANGDGGLIQVDIQADDGSDAHLPSGVVLASALITDPFKQWNRLITLDRAVNAQANTLYHVVLTNPSPDPVHNYTSIDTLYVNAGGVDSQPAAKTLDLAVLTKSDASHPFQTNLNRVPIFSIYFDDGFRQGQTYLDVRGNAVLGASGSPVSQAFAVRDVKHLATTLAIRLAPVVAQGSILVALTNNAGTILAMGNIDLSKATPNVYNWYGITFPQISLFKGAYTLVLTAGNGAQFYVSPIQGGDIYGFLGEGTYTGQCQVMSSNKWSGCLGRTDLDIPFYFR